MTRANTTIFALLISIASLTACKNKMAGSHLPAKQMERVLMDISLAEAYSTIVKDSHHVAGPKNYDSLSVYYKEILEHHKITQDQFSESLGWYKAHPTELDSVYTDLLTMATNLQSKTGSKL